MFIKRVFVLVIFVAVSFAYAADWPQWRGVNRDGKSVETGLLKEWPADGPKLLWFTEGIGAGYASVAVCDGTIYTTGNKEKIEYITAMDLKGNIKWQKPYGNKWKGSYSPARSCPTINDGMAYVVSGNGVIACFDIKSGEKKWSKEPIIEKKQTGRWGVAESPLVFDDKVIRTPCSLETTMIAFDKKTGKEIWKTKSLGDKAAYCSPILIEKGGNKIIVISVYKNLIGVDAEKGDILWQYDLQQHHERIKGVFPNTPIYHDGSIFANGGYNTGGVKVDLSADGTKITKAWFTKELDTHHGGVVLVDGYLYGSNWHSNKMGNWLCVDWKTGKTVFDTEWENKGPIIAADGMLYCYDEKGGNFGIAKATPDGFDIVSSFAITKGEDEHWMHPAISDGVLYVRHGDVLMAYDIKAK